MEEDIFGKIKKWRPWLVILIGGLLGIVAIQEVLTTYFVGRVTNDVMTKTNAVQSRMQNEADDMEHKQREYFDQFNRDLEQHAKEMNAKLDKMKNDYERDVTEISAKDQKIRESILGNDDTHFMKQAVKENNSLENKNVVNSQKPQPSDSALNHFLSQGK